MSKMICPNCHHNMVEVFENGRHYFYCSHCGHCEYLSDEGED